jgi:hypothetical protein
MSGDVWEKVGFSMIWMDFDWFLCILMGFAIVFPTVLEESNISEAATYAFCPRVLEINVKDQRNAC